ncbi:WD repeat-containing protein 5 homolog [Venturia canescens]|uniref:WD repeat-containing protein 5 homolog n=1 Tax=Venturia canescens TaxID=32260 RepID=UPI001C9D5B1A|nr:WD repeat-containing protein 5 homolog [Venturia canescens]
MSLCLCTKASAYEREREREICRERCHGRKRVGLEAAAAAAAFLVMAERTSRLSKVDNTRDKLLSLRDNEVGSSKAQKVSYSLTKPFVSGSESVANTTTADTRNAIRVSGPLHISSEVEGTHDILCVSYTETCDFIAVGLTDGTVRLVKVSSSEYTSTLRDTEMQQNPGPTTAIKHRPVHKTHPITQTLLVTYATGCVKSWHYPSGQCLYTIRENRQTLGLAYHPQLPKFVTVGDDTNLYLYDEETKTMERAFHASDAPDVMNGHRSRVFCACFNPKSSHEIISGGWDNTIQFWDTRQPYAIRRITGPHICGEGLDISKNGKEASYLFLWSIVTSVVSTFIHPDLEPIHNLCICVMKKIVLKILTSAWSKTNSLQLWDYGLGKLIVTLEPDSLSSQLYTGKYINSLFVATGGCENNLFRIVDLRSHSVRTSGKL